MRKQLLILLLLSASLPVFAQTAWTQKSDFPGGPRSGTAYFVINGKGYVGLGTNGGTSFNDWWEYNASADSWTKKADFPGPARYVPASVAIDDKGYVGMGATSSFTVLKDWWEYDPSADAWTKKASLPDAGRYGVSTFAIDGKGYLSCGNEQSAFGPLTNQTWMYDPATDSWTQKAHFPGMMRYGTIGFSIGSKGYAGLGGKKTDDSQYHYFRDFYEYDPASDSWTQKAHYPQGRGYASTFVLDGKAYVGLGHKSTILYKSFYAYDPLTDSWQQATIFSGDGRAVAFSFSINNKGYAGAGQNINTSVSHKDVWEFGKVNQALRAEETVTDDCGCQFTQYQNSLVPHLDQTVDLPDLEFQLIDLNGRKVLAGKIKDGSAIALDGNLPPGVYMISVLRKNIQSCTKKIVIQ